MSRAFELAKTPRTLSTDATGIPSFEGASIILNSDETGTPSETVAFEVERGTSNNVSIRWNESTDVWELTTDGISWSTIESSGNITLGTDTSGNYVATIAGTANEVEVSGSGSETAAVTIGLPNDVTIGNELTVTTALFTPIIDTTDSSALTVTPATTFSSDINVQNNIVSDNIVEAADGYTMGGLNSFRYLTNDDSSFAIGPGSLRNWAQTAAGYNNIAIGKNVLTEQRFNGSNIGIGSDSQRESTGFFNVGVGRSSLYANDSQSNVAIGDFTLSNSTTGAYNTAVGYNTGNDITTGEQNVTMGAFSTGNSTTGSYNTAIGYATLENVTNNLNVAVGYFAGNDLTTGFRNTIVGSYALDTGSTSAQENVAVGSSAMGNGVGGTKNVAVGRSAGANIASDFNTVIGADAGLNITSGSNLTVIGYDAEPSAAGATNEITLGDTNVTKLRVPGAGFELTSGTAVFDTKIEVPVIDTADSSAITVTPAAIFSSDVSVQNSLTVTNDVIVSGNLTVQGTTTQVDSNVVNIGDNIITLNADEAGSPTQNAGIEVERGTSANVQVRWNETTDKWQTTEDGATYSNLLTDAGNYTINNDVTIGNELTVTTALFTPLIDTTDSSAITVTPAAIFSSDVSVQNDLVVTNKITATGVITGPTTDTLLIKNSAGTTLKTIRGV